MKGFAKITDHPNLVRDMHTRAVLAMDPVLVRRHEKRVKDLQREAAMNDEIHTLRSELTEIKACLAQLMVGNVKHC